MILPINQLLCGDCIEVMQTFPKESIDLVVTSPPYNVEIDYGETFTDRMTLENWIEFTKRWMIAIDRVVAYDGRIAINVGSFARNQFWNFNWLIGEIGRKLKWKSRGEIIWIHGDLNKRTAWGSFCSPSDPCFNTPIEYICLFSRRILRSGQGNRKTDLTNKEFIKWSKGLWEFPYVKKTNHPAEFPAELPHRLIKMLSYIDDIILDPFVGSGTTCVVSQKLGRKWIGIDINPAYVEMAKQRIRKECSQKLAKFLEVSK